MTGRNDPPPPQPRAVKLEHAGKNYIGFYTIQEGMITVKYGGRQKATQLGGSASSPDSLARIMLGEMIAESQAKK
jgi:hypothetical protein